MVTKGKSTKSSSTTVRAAVYLRISLDATGEGLAVERQREDCLKIAADRGWKVTREYADSVGASNRKKRRTNYDAMVADFQAGTFDAIVCYDLDRLTRQPRQLEDWIDWSEDKGLLLVTANGEADLTTDGGRMYARIKAAVARAEIERKAERQRRAQRQRAEMGRPAKGVRPTGYTLTGAVLEPEASAVRAIFTAFVAGSSLRSIAAALNGDPQLEMRDRQWVKVLPPDVYPLPSRSGRPWLASTVIGILRNPRYAGWSVRCGQIVEKEGQKIRGQWKPLVSDEVFIAAQAILDDPGRVSNRNGTERLHIGSGLYRCGVCGAAVKTHGSRYRCAGHVLRARPQIDDLVLGVVRARLAQPDLASLLPSKAEGKHAELKAAIQTQRDDIARARQDYMDKLIDGEFYRDIKTAADERIAEYERQRLGLTMGSAAGSVLAAVSPVEAFDNTDLAGKRAVIDLLCQVNLLPAPRGRKTFDPETVQIEWRG